METKKIGPFLLSGLIIGPILGSGIIILPPLVKDVTGDYAIVAWIIIMVLSFFLALIFGKLSILFPGDAGVVDAVEHVFGKYIRQLTANFLMFAACLGPVAVLMTASEYIKLLVNSQLFSTEFISLLLMLFCLVILLKNITSIGKVSFFISTFAAIILLAGGLTTLLFYHGDIVVRTPFEIKSFGYSLLLLFWAIVGWEVIGNYSLEVKNPKKTIPKAILFSCIIICFIFFVVASAIQWFDPSKIIGGAPSNLKLAVILIPLFGSYALPLITIVTVTLCISTYLLFTGGVARLISAQAKVGSLPKMLSKKTPKSNIPIGGIMTLIIIHTVIIICVSLGLIRMEQIVAIADCFFLCNIILGLLSGIYLFKDIKIRVISVILILCFLTILFFSTKWVLLLIGLMVIYYSCCKIHSDRIQKVKLISRRDEKIDHIS